jgi:hypothetical protein
VADKKIAVRKHSVGDVGVESVEQFAKRVKTEIENDFKKEKKSTMAV